MNTLEAEEEEKYLKELHDRIVDTTRDYVLSLKEKKGLEQIATIPVVLTALMTSLASVVAQLDLTDDQLEAHEMVMRDLIEKWRKQLGLSMGVRGKWVAANRTAYRHILKKLLEHS